MLLRPLSAGLLFDRIACEHKDSVNISETIVSCRSGALDKPEIVVVLGGDADRMMQKLDTDPDDRVRCHCHPDRSVFNSLSA